MNQMETSELKQAAMLYRFLSHRLLHEPTTDELRDLAEGEIGESFIAMDCDLLEEISHFTPEDQAEMLAVDYCKLFIGPGTHLSPHESVVLGEGQFMGELTTSVMDMYREAGFVLDPNEQSIPDHLGVELAFIATLLESEVDCLDRDDEFGAQKFHDLRINFLTNHIAKVLPKLTDYVLGNADYPFYKNLLRFTRDWIEVDNDIAA